MVSCFTSCKKTETNSAAPDYYATALPASKASALQDTLNKHCLAKQIPGASCAVFVPNQGMWTGVFGNSHDQTPIQSGQYFTIGSNTKTFIAALILKLQEQGRLNINDSVVRYLGNGIPYFDKGITIKQLLNHTSGLGDFVYNPAFDSAIASDFYRVWQPIEMYPLFLPPVNNPGVGHFYSDQNYLLAGLVAETAAKGSMKNVMRQLIISPSGLNETYYYPFEGASIQLPHGWSKDFGGGALEDLQTVYGYVPISYCSADNAAGGMVSTARDNAIFWDKLMSRKIINDASLQQMLDFVPVASGNSDSFYGLGIGKTISGLSGRTYYYHYGRVPGYINVNAYEPLSGIVISLQTNQDATYELEDALSALFDVVKP